MPFDSIEITNDKTTKSLNNRDQGFFLVFSFDFFVVVHGFWLKVFGYLVNNAFQMEDFSRSKANLTKNL